MDSSKIIIQYTIIIIIIIIINITLRNLQVGGLSIYMT